MNENNIHRDMELIFDTPEGRAAVDIVSRIWKFGNRAFIVGGAVRDALLGLNPKDVDVATDLRPEQLEEVFGKGRVNFVGESFGVAIVKHMGEHVEVATFRKDGEYLDGRRPESVEFSSDVEVDSRRRDLTINALYFCPSEESGRGDLLDFHGGLEDIRNGIIRTVGDPEKRFSEDFLRMLRVVRFAARFDFDIDPVTAGAIRKMSDRILGISGERIFMELEKMITKNPVQSILFMDQLDLLGKILPEVHAMKGVEQPPHYHPEGDVFVHTMLMLEAMEKPASQELAFSVLLHDIGKTPTFALNKKGFPCFYGHEEKGSEMAMAIFRRLKCSNRLSGTVCSVIENHVRMAGMSKCKLSKIRRQMARPTIDIDLELCRLDAIGKGTACNLTNHGKLMEFREKFRNEPAVPAPLLTGNDLIDIGIPRGPEIGELLRKIQDLQLQGDIEHKEEAISFARRFKMTLKL